MSNNYIFVLILFVTAFISFTFLSSISFGDKEPEFDKTYEALSFDFPLGIPNGVGYHNT
jgi:hypothetical protein|tara:strand:- start:615 stop:791 length:177 start_codon:yes stop_codon:yes gene_type:complete